MSKFNDVDRARRLVRTGCCFLKEAQASEASCRGIEAHRARLFLEAIHETKHHSKSDSSRSLIVELGFISFVISLMSSRSEKEYASYSKLAKNYYILLADIILCLWQTLVAISSKHDYSFNPEQSLCSCHS